MHQQVVVFLNRSDSLVTVFMSRNHSNDFEVIYSELSVYTTSILVYYIYSRPMLVK